MSGLPDINMVGTLTADPELRFIPSGAAVATFTVATNKRAKNEAGEWENKESCFLRCTVWRQAAENVAETFTKGDKVMVSGELKQRSYTDKDGNNRTAFEVDVFEVGPSVKWATAKVNKVGRSNQPESPDWGGQPASDPWAAAPPSGPVDEPPF